MKTRIIILCVMSVASRQAQSQTSVRQDTVYVTTQAYSDSIVVRWAPGSVLLWQYANKSGYKVERRTAGEKDFKIVAQGPLKPFTLREWKQKTDTTNVHVATAAQMLLGEVMMQPQKAITFSQKLLTAEEQQNRLALALYSAEFSLQAANGLAMRWVDRNINRQTKYYYRVTLHVQPKNLKVISPVAYQDASKVYIPQPVVQIEAEGKDGVIEVRWDKKVNDAQFSGYFIERSENGKKFIPIETVPFKTVADKGLGLQHVYRDKIMVYNKDYYYRVRGVTSFADLGTYSVIVKAQSKDLTGPAPPSLLKAVSLDDKHIKLTWTDNPAAPDHAGYYIGRGTEIHGPFEKINEKPFKTSVREYLDEKPFLHKPNFYTIIAADKLGNESKSIVAMAVLKDYTPPAQPDSLLGKIDTLGVVSLAWKIGNEEDLMGYRVYRSNHPDQEFIQITTEPVPGNFYMDTIPLYTLTKKVYYKVAAFDFNYNPSEFSKTLELKRPDYVPPVKPVIKGYTVKTDTITLRWVRSSSDDISKHILFRKEGKGEWQPLAVFHDTTSFYRDLSAKPGTAYSYALEAIDHSGLSSGKTASIPIISSLPQRPAVKNVNGVFDQPSKGFRLVWEYDLPGEYKFVVYRGEEGKSLKMYGSTPGKSRTFTDNKLYKNSQGYEYALKVLFKDGTESVLSNKVKVLFGK